MSIRQARLPTGERLLLLCEEKYGIPNKWVLSYTLSRLRPKGLALNTVYNHLAGIAKGLLFCRSIAVRTEGTIDLLELTDDRLQAFGDLCRTLRTGGGQRVKAAAHYRAFVEYVSWLSAQPHVAAPDRSLQPVIREDFGRRAKRNLPATFDPHREGVRLGLAEEQRDLFLRVIIPESDDNPFGAMAFRNFTLMSMSFLLGLRAGELLGLKVSHVDLLGQFGRVTIARTANDKEDTRAQPACQKTLERKLPLTKHLTLACERLIEERRSLEAARRHPFLFVNCFGQPLSARGLRKCFQTLGARHPELRGLFNHQLRHDWNDRWNEMVEANGWDLARCQDQQLHAMGWKPGSVSPLRYGRRSQLKLADDRLLAMQELSYRGRGGRA